MLLQDALAQILEALAEEGAPGALLGGLDLRALRSVLNDEEQARAVRACALIESRGFNRGRDLQAALTAYLSDVG